MVGGVLIGVLVAHAITRTDDERGTQLRRACARSVDAMAGLPSSFPSLQRLAVEDELEEPQRTNLRGPRGRSVVVDEHREGDVLVFHEGSGIRTAPRADGDDLTAEALDLFVAVAQLRGVLAAEQSAEVAEEDQRHGPFGPVVTEPADRSGRVL